jgi:hypothetical protein
MEARNKISNRFHLKNQIKCYRYNLNGNQRIRGMLPAWKIWQAFSAFSGDVTHNSKKQGTFRRVRGIT